MAKITILPDNRTFYALPGESLYNVLKDNGAEVDAVCGGKGTCGQCKVVVEEGKAAGDAQTGRICLACKTRVDGDLTLSIVRAEDAAWRKSNLYHKPPASMLVGTRKFFKEVPRPSINDQCPDWERIASLLPGEVQYRPTLDVLSDLPELIRDADFKVTVAVRDKTVIAVEKGNTVLKNYGVSFDIGTTTVVAFLVNLSCGEVLAARTAGNPQRVVGADVISRVEYVSNNPLGGTILMEKIIAALNDLIDQLLAETGVNRQHLYEATVVGNTTMQHLLLGINPKYLALSPYTPALKSGVTLESGRIGLNIARGGSIYVLPNIAGFVGSDTVGVILSTGMHRQSGIRLAIDIGTNGEVALGSRDQMLVCSTAAGPAFEGARISHGMRAAAGAIEGVKIDGSSISCKIIGNTGHALGICGSGLIQCVAEMLRAGIVNPSGRLLGPDEAKSELSPALAGRIEILNGQTAFLLVPEDGNAGQKAIYITQRDIRELQLAKGAIAAGIHILKEEMNIELSDIEEVFLAGAFGSYIDIASAMLLGLLPKIPPGRVKSVGNAAGIGALQALLSLDAREEAQKIAACTRNIELSSRADFQTAFVYALGFNETEL